MSIFRLRAPFLLVAFLCSMALSAFGAPLPPSPSPCDVARGACWKSALDARWQYQLQGTAGMASSGYIDVNLSAVPFTGGVAVKPSVFDIDLYQDQALAGNSNTINTAAVQAIHLMGAKAICYVSAGTWEDWRPDASAFPASVRGKKNGWPGEMWLDIRQASVLIPLMEARVQKCVTAGFDGVEWDNVDGYGNRTGFPLKADDQINYNALLANLAHKHGLSVALKNAVELVPTLALYFDYAVNEECQRYNECSAYATGFAQAGKAVFQVEYSGTLSAVCTNANLSGRNAIKKTLDLFATPYLSCK
jgi:hypothetical protein